MGSLHYSFILFAAHWDYPEGDFGQDISEKDPNCRLYFGPEEDIGAWRAQVGERKTTYFDISPDFRKALYSYGGQVFRVDPRDGPNFGGGICAGSGFGVLNPFCDGNPFSTPSKVWALGFRQPWRSNVRPLFRGEVDNGSSFCCCFVCFFFLID